MQHFQGKLCNKIGLLCDKYYYAMFLGLINIVLPGFKRENHFNVV